MKTLTTPDHRNREMLTQDLLNELFYYNPDTGGFVRRVPPRYTKKCPPENDRYKQLTIAGKRYRVPRIVWLYTYGEIPKGRVIDHIKENSND